MLTLRVAEIKELNIFVTFAFYLTGMFWKGLEKTVLISALPCL